jgi:hypothetical protein
MEYTLTIIWKLSEPKFMCAQTEIGTIEVNVLNTLSISQIREELEDVKFISKMIDSLSHKHTILVPILVCYFIPQQNVKLKTLKFTHLSGESAAQLTEHIVHVVEEAKLIDKVHSTMQTTVDCLLVDRGSAFGKVYQHFYIYNVCVQTLKDFCDFVVVKYMNTVYWTTLKHDDFLRCLLLKGLWLCIQLLLHASYQLGTISPL